MTHKQIPARHDVSKNTVEYLFLGFPFEINEHIAAKNNMVLLSQGIGFVHEIHFPEHDAVAKRGNYPYGFLFGVTVFTTIAPL